MADRLTVRWLSVVGARPQFVKLAMVCRAIEKQNLQNQFVIEHIIVHTGQHYDAEMTDLFFSELKIPQPTYNLGVASTSFGTQLGNMLQGWSL